MSGYLGIRTLAGHTDNAADPRIDILKHPSLPVKLISRLVGLPAKGNAGQIGIIGGTMTT
jgi:hypothetical protein